MIILCIHHHDQFITLLLYRQSLRLDASDLTEHA